MAGREVREYTNLSDPKGFRTFQFVVVVQSFDFSRIFITGYVLISQIRNGVREKIGLTMRILLSNEWLQRLAH